MSHDDLVESSTPGGAHPSTYGYQKVADRIEAVLGVRPAPSTLRAAAARDTLEWDYPPRVTAGMPAPLRPRTSPARFSAEEVEEWLAAHPWVAQRQALAAITTAAARKEDSTILEAVRAARRAGASWTAVTEALHKGGWVLQRARVYQLFRDV